MNITTLTHSAIRRRVVVTMLATLALGATACGRSSSGGSAAAAPPTTVAAAPATTAAPAPTTTAPAAAPAPASAEPAAKLGKTALGPTIVGEDGLTLYAFTNDTAAASTCTGKCAEAWPPVIVPEDWEVGPGLDVGIFATTTRDDGTLQLVAGKFPLYHYSGDSVPGDLNGQGSGDVWFAVNLNGTLIKDPVPAGATPTTAAAAPATTAAAGAPAGTNPPPKASAPAPVATGKTALGDALVTADGLTLYGLTKDTAGTPTCVDKCAEAWPPVIVDGDQLPAGLDAKLFSVVARPDGTHQLKAGKWPLYRFAGDDAPGATNGQGSGGVWFVVAPDGKLIK